MATTDSTLASLTSIRTKIRRLTRSPSTSQLTNDEIDEYVNTFILYDFPEITLDKKLTFFVMPNVDYYQTNTVNEDDPLYNFSNKYLSVQPPVYVAGQQASFSQSREEFFAVYPKFNFANNITTGDGATVAYSGTLSNIPLLARSVMFNSVDSSGNGIVLKDVPRNDVTSGIQTQIGDLVVPDDTVSVGTINYLTGAYSFTFPSAPADGEDVTVQAYSYSAGLPTMVLYENNAFTFRPVPDQSYRVEIDCFQRPSELLSAAALPELAQWWQYIAYGAAKKIFEDRMDMESIQAIMPEYMNQRALVLRKLVVQQSSERTATIYSERGVGVFINRYPI